MELIHWYLNSTPPSFFYPAIYAPLSSLAYAQQSPSRFFPLADINFKAHLAPFSVAPPPFISSTPSFRTASPASLSLHQKAEDINTFQLVEG